VSSPDHGGSAGFDRVTHDGLPRPRALSGAEAELGRFIPAHYHYQMLLDEARMTGFRTAIEQVVPEGGRVLELGGGTGVLSFFAAARASRVWCVERQPGLAARARALLAKNQVADRVELIIADAYAYLPPEPVDVVICEMLHSALLRESQVRMLAAFRERYQRRFGPHLPVFVPEATLLGVEPVHADYDFFGYEAPLPLFEDPSHPSPRLTSLGAVTPYGIVDYRNALPEPLAWSGELPIEAQGRCNALRFVTSNVLAIRPGDHSLVTWMNQNLILPLSGPVDVERGSSLNARFACAPGDEIEVLLDSLSVGLA
jgi:predicted RNA methylase